MEVVHLVPVAWLYDNLFCVYDQTRECKDRENQFHLQGLENVLLGWQGAKRRAAGVIDRKAYPKYVGGATLFFRKRFQDLLQLKWRVELQVDLKKKKAKTKNCFSIKDKLRFLKKNTLILKKNKKNKKHVI